MIQTIYIEEAVYDHPRTRSIVERFPKADIIRCEQYTQVFNSASQNFRVQKNQPSLILALKRNKRVLPTPAGYGIGSPHNYYFSHMLNCLYDCRYCFLQGMFRSAHYVVFVNYEDFLNDIAATSKQHNEPSWYFSGYDCDSLAMEPVTGFIDYALDHFSGMENANLEIRTKSTQVSALLRLQAITNAVIAFSFTPQTIASQYEHKVPSVAKRIASAKKLQNAGWKIGIRLDPMIANRKFEEDYDVLFDQLFNTLDAEAIHSVSYGAFRLPRDFYKRIVKLYPREALFAEGLTEHASMVSYSSEQEKYQREFIDSRIKSYVAEDRIFPCDIS